jgi:hypothetical protein
MDFGFHWILSSWDEPLKSHVHGIDFNYAIDSVIISPSRAFKYVNGMFKTQCAQRVIVRFLRNEEADAQDLAQRCQSQFAQHVYALQTIQF